MRIRDLSAHDQNGIDSGFIRTLMTVGGLPNFNDSVSLSQSMMSEFQFYAYDDVPVTVNGDHTVGLQGIFSLGDLIYLGPGTYSISGTLDLKSDTHLILHPNATIQRSPLMPIATQMIRMSNVGRIIIEGGKIDGNKANGFGGYGQCAGIATVGAFDVVIRNMEIFNWPADITGGQYGYGIYLGSFNDGNQPNLRVTVQNVYVHDCDQNNAFLVSGQDILIADSTFANAQGTAPGSGLDIEPNGYNEVVQNVVIRNCLFANNYNGITCNNHYSGYWHDIRIEGCKFRNNRAGGAGLTGAGLAGSNYQVLYCTFANNATTGLTINGAYSSQVVGCNITGNGLYGISMIASRDIEINQNHISNNFSAGLNLDGHGINTSTFGTVTGNAIFNNGGIGIAYGNSFPLSTTVGGVTFSFNRTGNQTFLQPQSWLSNHLTSPDFRISYNNKVYQCTVFGITAPVNLPYHNLTQFFTKYDLVTGSTSGATGYIDANYTAPSGTIQLRDCTGTFINGETITDPDGGSATVNGSQSGIGPVGTGSDIVDGTVHWKYIMDQPIQQYGFTVSGEAARGVVFVENLECGNTVGHIQEQYAGDANTLGTLSILENQYDGQSSFVMTRSRGVAGEDKTGIPGNVTTFYGAGRAAFAANTSTVIITTLPQFARAIDEVHVTLRDQDTTLKYLTAKITVDGTIVVTGNAASTLTPSFSWEVVKKGSFPNNI